MFKNILLVSVLGLSLARFYHAKSLNVQFELDKKVPGADLRVDRSIMNDANGMIKGEMEQIESKLGDGFARNTQAGQSRDITGEVKGSENGAIKGRKRSIMKEDGAEDGDGADQAGGVFTEAVSGSSSVIPKRRLNKIFEWDSNFDK